MEIPERDITDMQRQVDACSAYIDALAQGCRSPEKVNTLLDAAMQKIELCCIDMRRLCERVRPTLPPLRFGSAHYHTEKIYGEVTRLDAGWLDIRLNALLPHCRVTGGTQYITAAGYLSGGGRRAAAVGQSLCRHCGAPAGRRMRRIRPRQQGLQGRCQRPQREIVL